VNSRQELIYLSWATMLVPLKGTGFRLSPLGETSVGGRKAVGVLVTHEKHSPLKMYFDAETHLPVNYQRKFKNVEYENVAIGNEVSEECVFSDYRNVQETRQYFRVVTFWDGMKVIDLTISEQKFYEKPLDDKLFTKP